MSTDYSKDIYVFSERDDIALELLAKGRELADDLGVELASISVGVDAEKKGYEHMAYGADKAFVYAGSILESFNVETYTDVISLLARQYKPNVLLIGATKEGKELAARIAQRLGVGYAPECIDLWVENLQLRVKRLVLGGRFVAKQVFRFKPQIATIPPRRFRKPTRDYGRKGKVVRIKVEVRSPRTEVIETKRKEGRDVRIEDAKVIVSIGRGIKNKEDLALIEELAKTIGGELGCSRPIAADLRWLSEDHWIGLSGHKVKPRLYIACGMSGQTQHIAGIRDAQVIVAVNIDPEAPIFKFSDYGIVGDLYEVVPALTEAFRRREEVEDS